MDEVVLALEGVVAPMDCFVADDGRAHGASSARTRPTAATAARPSCCGRASRAASSRRCGAPRSPSWSPSPTAAPEPTLRRRSRSTAASTPRPPRDPWLSSRSATSTSRPATSRSSRAWTSTVNSGEIHALMGPNGSGKSTLANAIMGHPGLEVTEGQILFDGEDITEADPDERARAGPVHGLPVPGRHPGRDHHEVPADGHERPPRGARRGARSRSRTSARPSRPRWS